MDDTVIMPKWAIEELQKPIEKSRSEMKRLAIQNPLEMEKENWELRTKLRKAREAYIRFDQATADSEQGHALADLEEALKCSI